MFAKKDTIKTSVASLQAVQTMPMEFYGGVNPIVSFKEVKKEVNPTGQPVLSRAEKVMMDKTTAKGHGEPLHAANLFTNSKFLIIGGIALFLLFLAGGGVYYWYQISQTSNNPVPPPVSTNIAPTEPVTSPEIIPTTTPEIVVPTTTPEIPTPSLTEFPSPQLLNSVDTDNDSLTDVAEQLLGTNISLPDSDNDSYADAHEIFYLYDPANKEPALLINSGEVKQYINQMFNYSVYYPVDWNMGDTKGDSRDILFSAINGENVEILVVDKDPAEDLATWLGKNAPTEELGSYTSFTSRFNVSGLERSDKLVYFFVASDRVYAIVFHPGAATAIDYRIVVNMMARSFNLAPVNNQITPTEIVSSTIPTISTSTSATTTE